jgi:ATP-dependent DNA helicase RecG
VAGLLSPLPPLVGGRTSRALESAFGMRTVGDLLEHYPRRIEERGQLTDLSQLRVDDDVTVLAEVRTRTVVPYSRRDVHGRLETRLEVVVSDGTGTLLLTFFGRSNGWRQHDLVPGRLGLFAGKVTTFRNRRQLTHPDYLLLPRDGFEHHEADLFADKLIPLYPATKDVRSWTISRAVQVVLDALDPVDDPLPAPVQARHGLMTLDSALHAIHQPETFKDWWAARDRLKWDEALGLQLALAQRRAAADANPASPRPGRADGILAAFDARLPFRLTAGQQAVGAELEKELGRAHPMHRLLHGEVGSGKTIVALRAMLQVVDSGGQAALLAPTEVLAAQHARTLEGLLGNLGQSGQLDAAESATRIALLTGSQPAAARKAALHGAASGTAGIVVGTHALIQDHVTFADLGLVVVDEQHRFGVEQRDALRGKARQPPHLLVMTATPIPRTVAMTVFGDLDVSTLHELPRGRSPITTSVVPIREKPAWLDRAWHRIREEAAAGHQAFVVCPRIGTGDTAPDPASDETDAGSGDEDADPTGSPPRPPLAVDEVLPQLAEGPLAGLRLAALHGRLAPDVRDATMSDFVAGRLDVLVATTVVEVGVDIPNATVMVVMDAHRFGVSALHQLRGRIGRGSAPGVCLLVTEAAPGSPARDRLDAVAVTMDGFELARLDVEQRREGDVLGVAQSGRRSQLRLLSLLRDEDLIVQARAEAIDLVRGDPDLLDHPLLAVRVADLVGPAQAAYLEKA